MLQKNGVLSSVFQTMILSISFYSSNIKISKYNYNSIPITRIPDKMTIIKTQPEYSELHKLPMPHFELRQFLLYFKSFNSEKI